MSEIFILYIRNDTCFLYIPYILFIQNSFFLYILFILIIQNIWSLWDLSFLYIMYIRYNTFFLYILYILFNKIFQNIILDIKKNIPTMLRLRMRCDAPPFSPADYDFIMQRR